MIGFAGIDEYFGAGASIWVGAGAAVLGYTPLVQYVAIQRNIRDIWVVSVSPFVPLMKTMAPLSVLTPHSSLTQQGTCEAPGGNWAAGKPFFVTGGGTCNDSNSNSRDLQSETR